MGIAGGDVLVVHSSLKSIGHVIGGAAAVVWALREAVGPRGTILMPSFTYCLKAWRVPPFDHASTPSRAGMITEVFRRSPGVIRSQHPTHSVVVCGALARELSHQSLDTPPLGIDSPFDRARKAGARILLIGVGQTRNSSLHLAEALAPAPYLSVSFTPDQDHEVAWHLPPGSLRPAYVKVPQHPGTSEAFGGAEPFLREAGILRDATLGAAACQLLDANACVEHIAAAIRRDPGVLLRAPDAGELNRRRLAHIDSLSQPQ